MAGHDDWPPVSFDGDTSDVSDIDIKSATDSPGPCGLLLSGGGARGAYQAGVIQALSEISSDAGLKSPFKVIAGVSAGAINAAFWAGGVENINTLGQRLVSLWEGLTTDRVFKTDLPSLTSIIYRGAWGLLSGGRNASFKVRSLLDTSPLHGHLRENIPLGQIQPNLDAGLIDAVGISATDYGSTCNITFVQTNQDRPLWTRTRRVAEHAKLDERHLLASSAIPLFFPPVQIDDRTFGDGCLRNAAPLSPIIHMGARRLIVVGVRQERTTADLLADKAPYPSIGRVISVIMNAIMMDAVDTDLERTSRINQTLAAIPKSERARTGLEPVEFLYIRPSQNVAEIALQEISRMPRLMRTLVRAMGTEKQSSEVISYLLFEPGFAKRIAELGYRDAMAVRDPILRLLEGESRHTPN